eukprot:TRINITY_DN590_c0_g1_i1.p2 TRINITY_DN590_c0_g1~~TRINITY_DN590_c0_g1_i1.p2  ORF type:complete len:290 (+),score=92.79 TRINITY_DN590_c0_g1_i1:64-933(+)
MCIRDSINAEYMGLLSMWLFTGKEKEPKREYVDKDKYDDAVVESTKLKEQNEKLKKELADKGEQLRKGDEEINKIEELTASKSTTLPLLLQAAKRNPAKQMQSLVAAINDFQVLEERARTLKQRKAHLVMKDRAPNVAKDKEFQNYFNTIKEIEADYVKTKASGTKGKDEVRERQKAFEDMLAEANSCLEAIKIFHKGESEEERKLQTRQMSTIVDVSKKATHKPRHSVDAALIKKEGKRDSNALNSLMGWEGKEEKIGEESEFVNKPGWEDDAKISQHNLLNLNRTYF